MREFRDKLVEIGPGDSERKGRTSHLSWRRRPVFHCVVLLICLPTWQLEKIGRPSVSEAAEVEGSRLSALRILAAAARSQVRQISASEWAETRRGGEWCQVVAAGNSRRRSEPYPSLIGRARTGHREHRATDVDFSS